ncbi:MAG TPA: hypothetical protein VHZ02_13580 [Acidimicrobiales bacterium]|nr:hypothetical protein [Acidimicrobiales bacterium]
MAGNAGNSSSARADDGEGTGLLSSMGAWLSTTFLKPPKPKAPKAEEPEERPLTEAERRQQAVMLDPTERKIGYTGVLLGLLISFGLTLPYIFDRHLTVTVKQAGTPTGNTCTNGFTYTPRVGSHAAQCTGKVVYPVSHWLLLMVLLLVFTIAIFVTVRIGRRVPVGFAVLIAGIAYESIVGLLGLIFIVPGAWLLFKAWKVRRDLATGEAPPSVGGSPGRPGSGRPQPPGASGSNKRYTPKAVPQKAVPAQGTRSKASPAKGTPAKGTRAKGAPAQGTPPKGAPGKGAPVKAQKKRPAPPAS